MPAHASQPSVTEVLAPGRDEVDPELLQLPDPPRKERRTTLALLVIAAVASLSMVLALSRDASYALSGSTPASLGDLRTADASGFLPNGYVEGEGMLAGAGAIRYEHPFEADSYRVAPVAGRADVWVELRVPAGEETSRFVPKAKFKGRLIPFSKAGLRHRGLASAVGSLTGQSVPEASWLLVDGQAPEDARGAVGLVLLFLGFAVWNVATFLKLSRKVK